MLPKAALLYELYERERSLARQRSELAATERAAPKSNDELFVVAAESLRVQAATKASACLEGFVGAAVHFSKYYFKYPLPARKEKFAQISPVWGLEGTP